VVIYDRDYSAFTLSKPSDYRFDEILADCDILYVSGITPALSDSLLEATEAAFAEAKARGMKIVYDVNYRPKLASVEKTREIFSRLSGYITHLICNEEHLKMLLDIDSEYGEDEREARLGDISSKAQAMTGIKNNVVTVRRTPSSSRAIFCAAYRAGSRFAMSSVYDLDVVDRVGSGDAFSAGFVYSLLHDFDEKSAVSFAAASCALKHEIINDVNFASVDEIEAVMDKGSFDVRR
jgi:2-dehydro-3-deoxygluconokinase